MATNLNNATRHARLPAHTQASHFSGENVKRISKAALGGLAGCALILGATLTASGEPPPTVYKWAGLLTDLRPHVSDGLLDGASASIRIMESPDEGTGFRLRVTGINLSALNDSGAFGAHVHVGPCTKRVLLPDTGVYSADTTGKHYTVPGESVSSNSEVWFNLVPDEEGVAGDETWVSFRPPYDVSDMSIVLHHDPTASNGGAGDREACLPIDLDLYN